MSFLNFDGLFSFCKREGLLGAYCFVKSSVDILVGQCGQIGLATTTLSVLASCCQLCKVLREVSEASHWPSGTLCFLLMAV